MGERLFWGRTFYRCFFGVLQLSREEEPFRRPFTAYLFNLV